MHSLKNLKIKFGKIEEKIALLQYQSRAEEIANSLVHGVGFGFSIAALVILVVFGKNNGTAWHIVSFSIFGATLIFLYFSSMLFHSFRNKKLKSFFRILDYCGIFLLIAGTYTPIALLSLQGAWGWTFFGIVWGLALIGIILRILFKNKIELVLSALYVLMGWSIIFAAKPMIAMLPFGLIIWLLIGGASYTLGLVFLSWKKLPFHHAVWHLFVLGGSVSHFFGILFYLAK